MEPAKVQMHGRPFDEIPDSIIEAWSWATNSDPHIDGHTPQQLRERAIAVAVARTANGHMVGFGGILRAHGASGHPLGLFDGYELAELGGTWVHPKWRGLGLGLSMMEERRAHVWTRLSTTHTVVCVTTVPQVQHGCEVHIGMRPITDPRLLDQLCWKCPGVSPGVDCQVCPLAPKGAWHLPIPSPERKDETY